MNIGMAGLVGHLIDTVAGLNGGRAEKVAEGVGRNRIRIAVEDPIDLPTGQGAAPAAEEQVRLLVSDRFFRYSLTALTTLSPIKTTLVLSPLPQRTVISLAVRDTSSGVSAKHSLIRSPV